jgi:hypothetical protein
MYEAQDYQYLHIVSTLIHMQLCAGYLNQRVIRTVENDGSAGMIE